MYVARLGAHFILKRMPLTGELHAPDCPSAWSPSARTPALTRESGRLEESAPGTASIRLAFPMMQYGFTAHLGTGSFEGAPGGRVPRLSLGGLLLYLWKRASLTTWHPGFAGKRNWLVVRKRLLEASQSTLVGRRPLSDLLYIPELFKPAERAAINARNSAIWRQTCTASGPERRFMLLIAEVKEIVPCLRGGGQIQFKHVPDQRFELSPQTYALLSCRFQSELSLWAASDHVRMMLIATFWLHERTPEVFQFSMMPVSAMWLPTGARGGESHLAPAPSRSPRRRSHTDSANRRHSHA